nr:zinc finger protein 284-like [Rhipicephalus microplus]
MQRTGEFLSNRERCQFNRASKSSVWPGVRSMLMIADRGVEGALSGSDIDFDTSLQLSLRRATIITAVFLHDHMGEQPFKCRLCPQSFSDKNTFNVYMCIHTGEWPCKCHLCPESILVNSKRQIECSPAGPHG